MKLWKRRGARRRSVGWAGHARSARSRRRSARRRAAWAMAAVLIMMIIGGGAAAVGVSGGGPRWEWPSPVIHTIHLRGLERLSAKEIRRLLPFREGDRLFDASLQTAAHRLSGQPWIAQATLYRSVPGTIVVWIQERQPVAVVREGEQAWYVDRQGVLLGPAGERPGPSGLEISGISVARVRAGASEERRRLLQGLALLELLRRDGVDTAVVTVRRDEELMVAFGGWRLYFRTGHLQEQWHRFWQVAERVPVDPKQAGRPREIDLRFANSVVVRM